MHCACLDKVIGASIRAVYGPAVARCLLPFKQHVGSGAEMPSAEDAEKPCFVAEVPAGHQAHKLRICFRAHQLLPCVACHSELHLRLSRMVNLHACLITCCILSLVCALSITWSLRVALLQCATTSPAAYALWLRYRNRIIYRYGSVPYIFLC